MQYIDAKFKDNDPISTVEKIQGILRELDIEVTENWNDSGVENCYSLSLTGEKGIPSSNGKGVSREFARASAYGEFIERLQGGLFFYKYQSLHRDPEMYIHSFAPDAKYMTVDELIGNGQWMDYLIETYKQYGLTRQIIAEHCKAYACSDDDRILTLPFYSLFEDQYVYLPICFVDHMYGTNGCCTGNTREEAWVHALSEMMERHASLKMILNGKPAPRIPDSVLEQYPTVSNILRQLRESGEFDVDIFDYSIGNGFPVISTRIISKKTHSYRVNVAADPVFEIAVQRTLTELFQGKSLNDVTSKHKGTILSKVSDVPIVENVINQLETSSGLYTADYFANELTCRREPATFADNSNKTNKELLDYMLSLYRQLGNPVYVRNFSYLGFPSYRFVVPGFSEAVSVRLGELVPEYAIADESSRVMRNVAAASDEDLAWMLNYSGLIRGVFGRYNHFGRISGIPVSVKYNAFLSAITRAYAAYKTRQYSDAIQHMVSYIPKMDTEIAEYFRCVNRYLELKNSKIDADKIRSILYKFYENQYVSKLYEKLDAGLTPYEDYLIACDFTHCDTCRYGADCAYLSIRKMIHDVGQVYKQYEHGQDRSEFLID